LHLAEISADVAPGKVGVGLLEQAGWHMSAKRAAPYNITLVPLPAKCPAKRPELNPQENVWQPEFEIREAQITVFDIQSVEPHNCCTRFPWGQL
jgi:hypothetical protein